MLVTKPRSVKVAAGKAVFAFMGNEDQHSFTAWRDATVEDARDAMSKHIDQSGWKEIPDQVPRSLGEADSESSP